MRVRNAGFAAALTFLSAGAACAQDIQAPLDQVRVVTFQTPAKTVFIGNPAIADITVIDATHVFIMGKNFGTTNIIALDAGGHPFTNQQVVVLDRPGSVVTVQRGSAQVTLNCSSERCMSAPTSGDDKAPFDTVAAQFERREEIASKAAGAGPGASGGQP